MVSINTKLEPKSWGYHSVIGEGPGYTTKYLIVNPGKELSYQYHNHRREIWTILEGKGNLTLDGIERIVTNDDSFDIDIGVKHTIKNIGSKQMIIHEVWLGDYLSENDIVRLPNK